MENVGNSSSSAYRDAIKIKYIMTVKLTGKVFLKYCRKVSEKITFS